MKPLIEKAGFKSCWIKRGDYHAMHKEDISFVRHVEEAQEVLQEYFYRGITRAVINAHLTGDMIKFYGIRNFPFFWWFCPSNQEESVYGWGDVDESSHNPLDEHLLKDICNRAANEVNIDIYGGDCIVGEDGSLQIIDFNDWPSFAPCRNEAAPHIAKAVLNLIKEHK